MTRPEDSLRKEEKIVVTVDICSSTVILEDLLNTNNIKKWRDLLIWLKEYLEKESKKMRANLYKFTGDGWIILFNPKKRENIIPFLSELSKQFEYEFRDKIENILDSPPDIIGLTFGIDEGPLVKMTMRNNIEYIGRAINVACRLQGVIDDMDIKAGYRAFMSHRLYNPMKDKLSEYFPDAKKRKLRNISGGRLFSLYRLSISKNLFRIIKATYGTNDNYKIDVTNEYISKIKDNRLDITVTNEMGDPNPGANKHLKIEYMYNGEKHKITFKERARVQLP